MLPLLRRWLLPAALSSACGVALALWGHDGAIGAGHRAAADAPVAAVPAAADPAASAAELPGGDPRPAARESSAEPAGPGELQRLQASLAEKVKSEPGAALAALLTLDHLARRYLAEDVVRQAAERAPDATLAWIDRHFANGPERLNMLLAAYTGIAVTDPQFALNQVKSLPDPGMAQHGVHRVLETWARHDPVAAYEWVRFRTGEGAADLHVTVMQAYMKALPQQAGELIAGMPPGGIRARLVDRYAFEMAESDAAAAADWLARFDGEGATRHALTTVYDQWASQDPWAAIEHAVQTVDGELSFELVGRVAVEMGLNRPGELASSLDRVPEPYRALAARQLAYAWSANDPIGARHWVDNLPQGALQEQARRGLAAIQGS